MSAPRPMDFESLPPAVAVRVDQACDRFEAAWDAGNRPDISESLGELPPPGRGVLQRELLKLELAYRIRQGERPTRDEYRRRFHEDADWLAAVRDTEFPPAFDSAALPRPAGSRATAADNLLFGILALQMDFIARDALIAAMNAWTLEKSMPLGRILVRHGALTEARFALLDPLVREQLRLHGDDPARSLAAVSPIGAVREGLEQIPDAEVHASLAHLATRPRDQDAFATATPSVGTPTSSGLRFRILRFHARGGLGAVYEAHDTELNRAVALKEIQPDHADHPESRARFLLEAEITGGLEHPGIVPVYGLGSYDDGRPFYAMRFIKGKTLRDEIRGFHKADVPGRDPGERDLELQKLLGRLIDVCNTVAYAHSRGVLHRDLKPDNVMVGEFGETLVVDWGLAKVIDRPAPPDSATTVRPLAPTSGHGGATQDGRAMGTLEYMSPEQAAGRLDQLGPASDVYSLGATLACLLTGRDPGTPRTPAASRRVPPGDLPRLRDKPAVPSALEAICRKAMAPAPQDRYASPLALASDLEHWLADGPVAAYREPWPGRLARWARRHRAWSQAGAAALLVVMVTSAAAAVLVDRAHRRERDAHAREAQRLVQDNFQVFLSLRDAVQSQGTVLKVIGLPSGGEVIARACQEALKRYGVTDFPATTPALDNRVLSDRQRAEARAGCYELLLLWAEAEAQATPSPGPGDDHLRRGLRILDRAGTLGRRDPALHRRRARYLALLGDPHGEAEELKQAEASKPTDAVDFFLSGQEWVDREDLPRALSDFDRALRLQPDHFGAQYFSAVCSLRLGRPAEAKVGLTACLGRRPDFVWALLLRGVSSGELGDFEAATDDFHRVLELAPEDAFPGTASPSIAPSWGSGGGTGHRPRTTCGAPSRCGRTSTRPTRCSPRRSRSRDGSPRPSRPWTRQSGSSRPGRCSTAFGPVSSGIATTLPRR